MRMARPTSPVLLRGPQTARWTSPASGMPVAAVVVAVLVVVGPPQPQAAEPHRQQVRRRVALVPHRLKALLPLPPGAERRRLVEHRVAVERRVLERREGQRRRPVVAVVAGAAGVTSHVLRTPMARSTPRSARWPAIPTACRR